MLAIKLLLFLLFLGDLTKAMWTPLSREVPPSDDLDLAQLGLDAGPKELLLMGGVGPSGPGHIGGEGLAISFFSCIFVILVWCY